MCSELAACVSYSVARRFCFFDAQSINYIIKSLLFTHATLCYDSTCCDMSVPEVLLKQLNESSWLLTRVLRSTCPTLCFKEIWISPKIRVLLSGTYCLQCFDTVGWAAGRASGL